MTEEQFEEIKEVYINHLKDFISEIGGLNPQLTILAEHIEEEEKIPAIIHIPIPDKYIENEDSKDEFINELLPELIIEVKKKFIPVGVAWASEAWMRIAGSDFDIDKENWKEIPIKKEVVIVSIETDDKTECILYDIVRQGKKVTENGDLIDNIELKLSEESSPSTVGGRFTGLYKLFKD